LNDYSFFSAPQLKRDPLGATPRIFMTAQPPSRLSSALRISHRLAAYVAIVTFARVAIAVLLGHEKHIYYLVLSPAVGYAGFFLMVLGLKVSGAIVWDPRDPTSLDVNPWFAWLVCGGLVAFFVGLLGEARHHSDIAPRVGVLAAAVWAVGLSLIWAVGKLVVRRGA
jgi:hypothetical protein